MNLWHFQLLIKTKQSPTMGNLNLTLAPSGWNKQLWYCSNGRFWIKSSTSVVKYLCIFLSLIFFHIFRIEFGCPSLNKIRWNWSFWRCIRAIWSVPRTNKLDAIFARKMSSFYGQSTKSLWILKIASELMTQANNTYIFKSFIILDYSFVSFNK